MKKYWIKLAGCAATAVVILLIILGMVDLHTDGILVRDGCYVTVSYTHLTLPTKLEV